MEARAPKLSARRGAAENEYIPRERDSGEIQIGTVGWEDADESVDPGTPDNETSGVTLIRVTLFSGKDPLEPHDPTRGQGTKILARNSAGEVVPAAGTQVVVVRPAGIDGPGAWHIVCNPGAGPGPILPAEGGTFFTRGLDGSINIGTTSDGTKDGTLVQFQIKRDGFLLMGPFGKISFDRGGFHLLHFTGARLDLGGIGGLPSPLDQLATYATLRAAVTTIEASALSCGPTSGGVPEQVAKALSTLTLLTAIQTQLGLMQLALDAIAVTTGPPGPPVPVATDPAIGTAVATSAGGMGTLATAFTVAAAAIPSQSTGAT